MSIHQEPFEIKTPFIIRLGLWIAIWAHILCGVITLFAIFPFATANSKQLHIQKWSQRLLKIFGIELRVINADVLQSRTFLLSSNHISWIDIHVINSLKPIRFVAKSEVEGWPIFGWMAKQLGTVFIKRDKSRHAQVVVNAMSEILRSDPICIFPEGTSTNGEDVRPFRPNLFESAVISEVPVYSLAIRYLSKVSGERSDVPAFIGDMGLLESMSNILRHRNLVAELTFFPPPASTPSQPKDRKWLALHSYEQISRFLSNSLSK